MNTAVITLTDTPDGKGVTIDLVFSPECKTREPATPAQRAAMIAMEALCDAGAAEDSDA